MKKTSVFRRKRTTAMRHPVCFLLKLHRKNGKSSRKNKKTPRKEIFFRPLFAAGRSSTPAEERHSPLKKQAVFPSGSEEQSSQSRRPCSKPPRPVIRPPRMDGWPFIFEPGVLSEPLAHPPFEFRSPRMESHARIASVVCGESSPRIIPRSFPENFHRQIRGKIANYAAGKIFFDFL